MEIKYKDTLLKLIAEKADDASAFSGGAQVVSIEDVYELLSPNSFENLARKYSHYYNDTWHFSDEFLKQFAEAYASKVLEDKEREIAEQKAQINDLREALELVDGHCKVHSIRLSGNVQTAIDQALAKTALQSLAEHDNALIERCAKVCDDAGQPHQHEIHTDAQWVAKVLATNIRALKVTQ